MFRCCTKCPAFLVTFCANRVLINADTRETEMLLNDRMGYVAVSRARDDAIIYTNSIEELRSALDRRVGETAFEVTLENAQHRHELKDDQKPYDVQNRESFEKEQSFEKDQSFEQDTTDESVNNRAAEAIETEETEFSLL